MHASTPSLSCSVNSTLLSHSRTLSPLSDTTVHLDVGGVSDYITPNPNPPHTNEGGTHKVQGILSIVSLIDSDEPVISRDSESQTISNKCTSLITESESISMSLVNLRHHQRVMKQAIDNSKPPKGLTPKLKLNAHESSQELEDRVDEILCTAGLEICKLLQQHYDMLTKEKQQANITINKTLEGHVATATAGPDKDQLLKLINERVEEAKTKVGKRKADLAARFSDKKETGEQSPDDDQPRSKRPRPNEQSGDEIATLKQEIARVSNIETRYTTHLDTMSSTDRGSSVQHPPGERQRSRERAPRPQPRKRWQKRPASSERKRFLKKAHRDAKKRSQKLRNKHFTDCTCTHASVSNNIVNLSQHNLTQAERNVLSRGLSFVPKPKNIDLPDIRKGLIKFRAQIVYVFQAEYRA